MRFYTDDRQNKPDESTTYFDQQRIDGYAVYIRQMAFKIISCNAEERPARRLERPGRCGEHGKPILNRCIVAHRSRISAQ